MPADLPITADDVRVAHDRIRHHVHRTPVLTSRAVDELTGASVLFKAENLQRTGAFKARGAFSAISAMSPERLRAGVVAYSSGNHAQAVALAARELGARARILMPRDAPPMKLAATRGYGAEVIEFDRYTDSREEMAAEIAERTGAKVLPPFDHPDVMAGQGTAALELLEEAGELDLLIAPIGGGGLISGCAVIAREMAPGIEIVGVEPETGDDARRSLAAGRIVRIDVPRTIADSAQTRALGELTFPVIAREVSRISAVSDAHLARTARFLLERMKTLVEPTGALGPAALLAGDVDARGKRVGVILSGGNVELRRLAALTAGM